VADALDDMPLHDITELLGERGLRDRLAIEIKRLPEDVQARAFDAYELASLLHRDDWRTREPYVNHLLRVAIRIMHHYGVTDPDVVCAALLHDAVEDHPTELAAMAGSEPASPMRPSGHAVGAEQALIERALVVIARRFGVRTAELVSAVTNPPYDPGRDAAEQYRDHVVASLDAQPWARVIKLSDFTDNAVGIVYTRRSKAESVAGKYFPLVDDLRELAGRPDTPLSDEVKAHIDEQLRHAGERLGDLLDHDPAADNEPVTDDEPAVVAEPS
jgi:HD domain